MNRVSDRNYLRDGTRRWSIELLKKTLTRLLWVAVAAAGVQVVLLFLLLGSCTQVMGVSLSGNVFASDSYTCPVEGAAPVYPHRAQLLEHALSNGSAQGAERR